MDLIEKALNQFVASIKKTPRDKFRTTSEYIAQQKANHLTRYRRAQQENPIKPKRRKKRR